MQGSAAPINAWFLWSTAVQTTNSITTGSAILAGLTITADQQTDHATASVTMWLHLCSTG